MGSKGKPFADPGKYLENLALEDVGLRPTPAQGMIPSETRFQQDRQRSWPWPSSVVAGGSGGWGGTSDSVA